MSARYDAIVLGAGAAGLMAAARAGQRGRRVLLLERASKPGKKILISGGGRCNFTNLGAGPEHYLSGNPHFAKSALSRYTARDFLELVESYGIAWHEKTLGQLFCDGSAKQIVDLLLEECAKGDASVRCDEDVTSVERTNSGFRVTSNGTDYAADALVIATGGPSIPKMGATGFAYDLARQFGLTIVEPRPALVPLTLGGEEVLFRTISGVAAPVTVGAGSGKRKASFAEAALFTHKGLSGPAILQASSYWAPGEEVVVNFLPDERGDWLLAEKAARPRAGLRSVLRERLPDRLADMLAERLELPDSLQAASDKALRQAQKRLARWAFRPSGTEGFAKAEVTAGGIATSELSSRTMEAKRVPGLYAVGEAVDVTGWLGGYNFQWAWASGVACGEAL